MAQSEQVVVIGAGVVGCAIAAELSRQGAQVTVIDKGAVGQGCSYGNAGWMTPCFAMPLPLPGMFLKSLKWLLNPESPLYIKPVPSVLLFNWLTQFMMSMNEREALKAIDFLVQLSKDSLAEYQRLDQKYPGRMGFEQKGLLMVGQSAEGVKSAVTEMDLVARHQVPGRYLTPKEIKDLEPSLVGPIEGGVYFPQEAHAEPLQVVQVLAEEAKAFGARFQEGVELLSFNLSDRKIHSIQTQQGEMKADVFILATGSWSTALARQIGIEVTIMGGKGYSMILPPLSVQPKHPIMLVEKKVAITPRKNSLRVAGTLELVDQDFSITERRVQAILKGAREFLPIPEKPEVQELWRGLRPCTPTGVPHLGWSHLYSNLMLACGHQMLGLQSATGSAKYLAKML